MWHFLFALFQFLAILINFRFLFFSGLSQTLGNSTPGLSEAEKLAATGERKITLLSQEEPILEPKQKKHFIIFVSNIEIMQFVSLNNFTFFRNLGSC